MSPPSIIVVTETRRTWIQSILSPPTVTLERERFQRKDPNTDDIHKHDKSCSLCLHFDDGRESESSTHVNCDYAVPLVMDTVRRMMRQVGLHLEDDMTFCSFCLLQLQNLVRVKGEVDRLGDRLTSMVRGLHTIFSSTTSHSLPDDGTRNDVEGLYEPCKNPENDKKSPEILKSRGVHKQQRTHTANPTMPKLISKVRKGKKKVCTAAAQKLKVKAIATTVQKKQEGLSCSVCQKSFHHQNHLNEHSLLHTGIRPFSCPTCSRTFTLSRHLKYHMRTSTCSKLVPLGSTEGFVVNEDDMERQLMMSTEIRPFRCELCPKSFTRKGHLENHVKTHLSEKTKPKPYHLTPRELAQKLIKVTRSSLQRPQDQRPSYPCQGCDKRFSHKARLERHRKTCHGERPYPCPKCSNRFAVKSSLRIHLRSHLPFEEWPFPCHLCPRRFTQKINFDRHVISHLPEEKLPFACPNCPRRFGRKDGLKNHVGNSQCCQWKERSQVSQESKLAEDMVVVVEEHKDTDTDSEPEEDSEELDLVQKIVLGEVDIDEDDVDHHPTTDRTCCNSENNLAEEIPVMQDAPHFEAE